MEVRTCTTFDLMNLELQPSQAAMRERMTPQYCRDLLAGGDSYCATVAGNPVACIGLIHYWETRKYVWAFLAPSAGQHMLTLTRAVRRWLKYHGAGRLETAVDCRNDMDIRWAELLGFTREGVMRKWTPEGLDVFLYARIGQWP